MSASLAIWSGDVAFGTTLSAGGASLTVPA
jgi:hypothetical protein